MLKEREKKTNKEEENIRPWPFMDKYIMRWISLYQKYLFYNGDI